MNKRRAKTTALDAAAATIAANTKDQSTSQWSQDRIADLKAHDGKVGTLPITLIRTDANVRQRIDEESPEQLELVESVRRHGILQPPVVTVVTNEHGVHHVLLVAGERRLLAAKRLGHDTINCLVRIFDNPTTRLTAALSENLTRQAIHTLDVAAGYAALRERGYPLASLEALFGVGKKSLSRFIKMSSWPAEAQELVRQHPERFTTRKLLALASRKLEPPEITEAIQDMVQRTRQQDEEQAADTRPPAPQPLDRLMAYCQHRGLSKRERDLLMRALTDLGVLRQIKYEPPPPREGTTGQD